MTEEQLEASIAADSDDAREEPGSTQAVKGLRAREKHINIRIDA